MFRFTPTLRRVEGVVPSVKIQAKDRCAFALIVLCQPFGINCTKHGSI